MASYVEKETQAYLEGFSSRRRAKKYSERCRRESGKRQKESAELQRLLAAYGPFERVLDMPCGAGPYFDLVKANSRVTVGADGSPSQMEEAAQTHTLGNGLTAVQANAAHLPFKDASFDCVLSVRFFHHLFSGAARVEAFKELARVSSRFVLVTFYDYTKFGIYKSAVERLRGRSKKMNLKSVALSRFAIEAAKAGLKLVKASHYRLGTRSIFVLFEKCPQEAAEFLKKPEALCRRLRIGKIVEPMLPLILTVMALVTFSIEWKEVEKDILLWGMGLPILALGALLLGGGLFFKRRHAQSPFNPEGPYKVVRHPMVAGAIVWMAGLSAMCEIPWFIPIAAVLLYFSFGPIMELAEARMFLAHENAYDEYCAETAPLMPYRGAFKKYLRDIFVVKSRFEGAFQYTYSILFFVAGVFFAIAKALFWDHV